MKRKLLMAACAMGMAFCAMAAEKKEEVIQPKKTSVKDKEKTFSQCISTIRDEVECPDGTMMIYGHGWIIYDCDTGIPIEINYDAVSPEVACEGHGI